MYITCVLVYIASQTLSKFKEKIRLKVVEIFCSEVFVFFSRNVKLSSRKAHECCINSLKLKKNGVIFPDAFIQTAMKRNIRNTSRTVVPFSKKQRHQKLEQSVPGKFNVTFANVYIFA